MGNNNDVALRKRQQIDSSKRTMFIFVASAAFASGIALVVSFFLVQQIWFHGRVISEKQKTVSTISANLAAVDDLKDNIRVLDTNEALNSVRSSDESSALQVVLDALPSEPNADALGASLQLQFVGAVDGLTLESLSIEGQAEGDSAASESTDETSDTAAEDGTDTTPGIGFTMSVSGTPEGLKELLARFERSIRVIRIDSLDIEAGKEKLTMKIVGRAYYQPAQEVKLDKKVVKP